MDGTNISRAAARHLGEKASGPRLVVPCTPRQVWKEPDPKMSGSIQVDSKVAYRPGHLWNKLHVEQIRTWVANS